MLQNTRKCRKLSLHKVFHRNKRSEQHVNTYFKDLFTAKHVKYMYIACEDLLRCKNNTYNLTCDYYLLHI